MYLMGSPVVAEKVLHFLVVGWDGDLGSFFMIVLGIRWQPMRATPSMSIDRLRKKYYPLTSICAALFLFPAEVACEIKRSGTFLFFLLCTAVTKLLNDISRIQITKNKYTYSGMDNPRQFEPCFQLLLVFGCFGNHLNIIHQQIHCLTDHGTSKF